jgi:hypothetical protein
MRLGDLPGQDQDNQQGDVNSSDDQSLPVTLPSPADIWQQQRALDAAAGVRNGATDVHSYTVAVFDSRPPAGFDTTHDTLTTIITGGA